MNNIITIIDYGYGNLFSIQSAFKKLNIKTNISKSPEEIEKSKVIVLPGVGSFYQAMNAIKLLKLDISIKKALKNKTNILGICLGYQMLFEESEEFGTNKGLGLIKGKVISLKKYNKKNFRVPNVGWRPLILNTNNKGMNNFYDNKMVYFVHSFIPKARIMNQVSSYIKFGEEKIHSSIHYNNIVGFQFHPEKSGEIGLNILKDTINYFL